ncbi:MAG: lipid-A-disaccharide synthase [Thermodesulfobacteriota bacterium]
MKPKSDRKCVMIIAGEASGDHHGAHLVKALQARDQDIFFCGIGGRALEEAGVRNIVDAATLSVVGFTEVLSKGVSIWKGLSKAKQLLKSLRPDLLILIDFPDFNLHVAAKAKKLGVPVLYYISPQLWAWRAGRVKKIKQLVDHMAVILPFELDFYKEHGVPATYVGHPLLDGDTPMAGTGGAVDGSDNETVIGLLPGSRDKEVIRNLPVMLLAAETIQRELKQVKFIISQAPTVKKDLMDAIIAEHGSHVYHRAATDQMGKVFKACRLVIAVSGTVTLEAAIWGTPMVIIYKLSPVSYWLGRFLVKVEHIGLVNLIAGRRVVPELIQKDASPANVARIVLELLADDERLENMKTGLADARSILGKAGASSKVAEIALGMLHKREA